MDLLDSIGGLFISIGSGLAAVGMTAADTVTAALSIAAIAMSGAALRQNAKYRPKPHFWIEWSEDCYFIDGVLVTVCRFGNDGTDAARNLRVTVKGRDIECRLKHWDQWDKFADGERDWFEVPLQPGVRWWAGHGSSAGHRGRAIYQRGHLDSKPNDVPVTRNYGRRPIVKLKYRGRWLSVRSKAPDRSTLRRIDLGQVG